MGVINSLTFWLCLFPSTCLKQPFYIIKLLILPLKQVFLALDCSFFSSILVIFAEKMKRLFLLSLFVGCVAIVVVAQDAKAMRDSLARASRLLDEHPDSIDLRLKKAAWNVELEQWEFALDEYSRVLTRQPNNLAALFFRAYVNGQMGRYGFARQDYEQLLAIVPAHFEARLGLTVINQQDRRYVEALDQVNRLIEQYPDSAIAWAARADIEAEQGQAELAVYDYSEAISRDKQNTDYLILRARQLILLNRRHEAYADLDRAVALGIPKAALRDEYK